MNTIESRFNHFLSKANKVHSNKYDYSKVIFVNVEMKIDIICPIHGIFSVRPADHIHAKSGCRKCNGNYVESIEELIALAAKIHNQKYDYSLLTQNDLRKSKISIICPDHGVVEVSRLNHLKGVGCRHCTQQKVIQNKITKGFITDPKDKEPFQIYREKVRRLSDQNYIKYYWDINPANLRRGKEYHLDHIVSITTGFLEGIDPKIIASSSNLRIIPAIDNIKKGVSLTDAVSYFDPKSIITKPLSVDAKKVLRLKQSNKFQITDTQTNEIYVVESITDWCLSHNFSVSSARWTASYGKGLFKERYKLTKLPNPH